ncbi:hypothetical protein GQR58_019912 [Nymphon striatum]|nr:hypothetical protein GQR58_019912 [Nymphon striatum]
MTLAIDFGTSGKYCLCRINQFNNLKKCDESRKICCMSLTYKFAQVGHIDRTPSASNRAVACCTKHYLNDRNLPTLGNTSTGIHNVKGETVKGSNGIRTWINQATFPVIMGRISTFLLNMTLVLLKLISKPTLLLAVLTDRCGNNQRITIMFFEKYLLHFSDFNTDSRMITCGIHYILVDTNTLFHINLIYLLFPTRISGNTLMMAALKLKLTRNTKMSDNPKIFILETFLKSPYSSRTHTLKISHFIIDKCFRYQTYCFLKHKKVNMDYWLELMMSITMTPKTKYLKNFYVHVCGKKLVRMFCSCSKLLRCIRSEDISNSIKTKFTIRKYSNKKEIQPQKRPFIEELPVPSGSWAKGYGARQKGYNMQLIGGLVFFGGTLAYVWLSYETVGRLEGEATLGTQTWTSQEAFFAGSGPPMKNPPNFANPPLLVPKKSEIENSQPPITEKISVEPTSSALPVETSSDSSLLTTATSPSHLFIVHSVVSCYSSSQLLTNLMLQADLVIIFPYLTYIVLITFTTTNILKGTAYRTF